MKNSYKVPFLTPLDYFLKGLKGDPSNINIFPEIQRVDAYWKSFDTDLHIYPYIHAIPAILSMGCKNQCDFCPSAKHYKGNVYFGDPEIIIPYYAGQSVHFMDENFFLNDMDMVLPLLKERAITWLAMATCEDTLKVFDKYGEDYLYDCGLRVVEVGLENIALMRKVKGDGITHSKIEIYYLNVTFLPGESKKTIYETTEWMKTKSLDRPIHFNNGLWYAPGQFYFPYDKVPEDGIMLKGKYARVRPTFVPNSFLDEEYCIMDLEKVNYYAQLVYDIKIFPKPYQMYGIIRNFINGCYTRTAWMVVGLRCGGIR